MEKQKKLFLTPGSSPRPELAGDLAENPDVLKGWGENIGDGDPQVPSFYCETCKASVSAEELAKPTHIGHGLRQDQADTTMDTIGKNGGGYKIGWQTK